MRYLWQTFIWFCQVNTLVTLVTVNVALFLRMAQQIICSFRCLTYFLMNRSVMMQFQIALGWFLKLKQVTQVNHNKNLMIQACNFIKKRLHHRWFPVINAKFWRTPVSKSICNQLLLKIYPLLLFWFLEEISEVAFCQRSAKSVHSKVSFQ